MRPELDRASLADMLTFAREVVAFVTGRTRADLDHDRALLRADLDHDRALLRAVERGLELVGESARRISLATQDRHASIPWRRIVGMRNIIAHEYGRIDLDEVWRTVQRDIPPLVRSLEAIMAIFPPPDD